MLQQFIGDKPWFNSFTMVALFIFSIAEAYAPTGLPFSAEVGVWVPKFALVLGTLGLRKAQQAGVVPA